MYILLFFCRSFAMLSIFRALKMIQKKEQNFPSKKFCSSKKKYFHPNDFPCSHYPALTISGLLMEISENADMVMDQLHMVLRH